MPQFAIVDAADVVALQLSVSQICSARNESRPRPRRVTHRGIPLGVQHYFEIVEGPGFLRGRIRDWSNGLPLHDKCRRRVRNLSERLFMVHVKKRVEGGPESRNL